MTAEHPDVSSIVYKDIPNFPGYRVGDDGSVWSCRYNCGIKPGRWKLLKPGRVRGYLMVILSLDKKKSVRYVHRLVLDAFVGPRPEGQQARHLDGVRSNNRLENLRWGTIEENRADNVLHGTSIRGTRNPKAKLNEEQVREIRAMRAAGYEQLEIAVKFGVTQTAVSAITNRKTWPHVA